MMKRRREDGPARANISGGPGVRVADFAGDVSLSSRGWPARFRGAWYCARSGEDGLRVGQGYVNGLEPFVAGRPMSGLDASGAADPRGVPLIKLKADEYDDTGRSWICVRARVDETGRMADKPEAEDLSVVQSKTVLSGDQLIGLFAVAVLRREERLAGNAFGKLRQIAYFDLQHATRKTADRPDGSGGVVAGRLQHFFFPA